MSRRRRKKKLDLFEEFRGNGKYLLIALSIVVVCIVSFWLYSIPSNKTPSIKTVKKVTSIIPTRKEQRLKYIKTNSFIWKMWIEIKVGDILGKKLGDGLQMSKCEYFDKGDHYTMDIVFDYTINRDKWKTFITVRIDTLTDGHDLYRIHSRKSIKLN